jgi:hypothetical protein
MIYTAPWVRFLMCADRLRGQVGRGWIGAGNREFCGPCEIAYASETTVNTTTAAGRWSATLPRHCQ